MSIASALKVQRAINAKRAERGSGAIITTIAADFLNGGAPTFARAFDSRGLMVGEAQRLVGEPWAAFRDRVKGEALKIVGARSLAIGGLPDAGIGGDGLSATTEPPRGAIVLPETALHPSQVAAFDLIRNHRRVVLVCGRRWGKSTILITLAVDAALSGKRVGVFAPTRTLMSPLLREIAVALRSVPGASINTVLGELRLPNGGHVDFWSIDHTGRAGRGRKYHLVLIDEAAHDEGYLRDAFAAAIAPTLLDYAGLNHRSELRLMACRLDNHFWQIAHLAEHGFKSTTPRRAPTRTCQRRRSGPCGRRCGPRSRHKS